MAWTGIGDINQIIERQDITNVLLQKILTELVTTRHRLGYELEQLRTVTEQVNPSKQTERKQTPAKDTDQQQPL